jgi:succinate dehydrogenase/fumarate reductase cytochrome b subunit
MSDDQIIYRRELSTPSSWRDFSVQHVAFGLHRITGWLLLGWIVLHLGLPARSAPTAVWAPTSPSIIVLLLTVLVFHTFNGIRLLAAEVVGVGAMTTKRVFVGTLVACIVLVVGLGGAL